MAIFQMDRRVVVPDIKPWGASDVKGLVGDVYYATDPGLEGSQDSYANANYDESIQGVSFRFARSGGVDRRHPISPVSNTSCSISFLLTCGDYSLHTYGSGGYIGVGVGERYPLLGVAVTTDLSRSSDGPAIFGAMLDPDVTDRNSLVTTPENYVMSLGEVFRAEVSSFNNTLCLRLKAPSTGAVFFESVADYELTTVECNRFVYNRPRIDSSSDAHSEGTLTDLKIKEE